VVGGKMKGKFYGVEKITANYIGGNDSLKYLPSTSSCNFESLNNLRQHLSARVKVNDRLNC